MNEKEWLKCKDPSLMIAYIRRKASDRKLRLFCCACCRQVWQHNKAPKLDELLEVAEAHADGAVTERKRERAHRLSAELERSGDNLQDCLAWAVWDVLKKQVVVLRTAPQQGDSAAAAVGYAARHSGRFYSAKKAERRSQAPLARDIFGNPFRRIAFVPEWRTTTALALARGTYDQRDFTTMPILADALQDAGCESEDILNHLRDPNATHVRGCWALDLVLGKE
jgi:hypothetical protein